MPADLEQPRSPEELADPDWFREPSRREHWIGAALFTGFAIFFILLFIVLRGWWFRWVILALAFFSFARAINHVIRRNRGTAP